MNNFWLEREGNRWRRNPHISAIKGWGGRSERIACILIWLIVPYSAAPLPIN